MLTKTLKELEIRNDFELLFWYIYIWELLAGNGNCFCDLITSLINGRNLEDICSLIQVKGLSELMRTVGIGIGTQILVVHPTRVILLMEKIVAIDQEAIAINVIIHSTADGELIIRSC